MGKITDEITEKRKKNLKPAWKKGHSGNPSGKPLGTRDRRTVLLAAMKRIAEKKGITPEELEEAFQVAGIEKGIKGNFAYHKEITDGLYGKITDKVDVTSKGKTLAEIIAAAHAKEKAS